MSDQHTPGVVLLVDGSSYLYRAYHALPDLRGPDGFPTGALHGFVAMLQKLREQFPAAHAACVFDAKGKTFRDDWYPEYKAHRTPMPEPLAQQIGPIHEAVRLLGWPVLEVPEVEADDVIGTLCAVAAAEGHEVVVSTGDKDLAQLVTPRVTLINTMSAERLDVAGVQVKFGVPPERIVDYLTLMGDAVDNVPGVDKVGPKTAAKWINEHGSLEGVMAAAGTVKGVAGENLRKALDWLPMGRRLVTVRTDCDLAGHVAGWPGLDALALRPVDGPALLDFYGRYGFKTFRRDLQARLEASAAAAPAATAAGPEPVTPAADPSAPSPAPQRFDTVLDEGMLDAWVARLEASPLAVLDVATDGADPMTARLVGLAVAVGPGEAAYLPLGHDYAGAPAQLAAAPVLARLARWLGDPAALKLGHDTKFLGHVAANAGVALRGVCHDTLLQSYVVEAHRTHTLESLCERHLGQRPPSRETLCGKGAGQIPFAQVDVERAAAFCAERAALILRLHHALAPQVEAEPGLARVYGEIEVPVSDVLQQVERHGVLIDPVVLASQSRELGERMLALEQEAYAIAGQPFNMGSPKQIGEILFGKLGLPVKKKTATGVPSTDEDVLTELAADYPLPARLLEHRSLSKLKGTYTDKLPLMVNPATGRVHTHYAQAVAVTGRLSSNDPNLQNIPIRTAEGRKVREAFVAPPGHAILSADYSQIELRIMAHISGDPGLLRAFSEGMDVHRATASEVFATAPDAVTHEQRRYAKTINFGLIYGMGAFGLAQALGIERNAAASYIERYFERFAGVKRYMDDTRAAARRQGYVETLFGRRIYLPEINGGSGPRKSAAERQAINAPMQGTAADLIKLAMIALQRALAEQGRSTRMVMQVHDELVCEVPEAELAWARETIPRLMASVATLRVPLLAEVGVGPNWDQAH
jgi:DNA polymerase-1